MRPRAQKWLGKFPWLAIKRKGVVVCNCRRLESPECNTNKKGKPVTFPDQARWQYFFAMGLVTLRP